MAGFNPWLTSRLTSPVTHLLLCSLLQTVKSAAQSGVWLLDVTDNLPLVLAYSVRDSLKQRLTVTLAASSTSHHSLSPGHSPATWNTLPHSLFTMTTDSTFGHSGLETLTVALFVPVIEVTNYILNWSIKLCPRLGSRCWVNDVDNLQLMLSNKKLPQYQSHALL